MHGSSTLDSIDPSTSFPRIDSRRRLVKTHPSGSCKARTMRNTCIARTDSVRPAERTGGLDRDRGNIRSPVSCASLELLSSTRDRRRSFVRNAVVGSGDGYNERMDTQGSRLPSACIVGTTTSDGRKKPLETREGIVCKCLEGCTNIGQGKR